MKGGGSRLNVNIHKPRSALIRIENKVLPSSRAAQSPASDPRPRPQLPPAAIHPHIRHAPSERASERAACPAPRRPRLRHKLCLRRCGAARRYGTARHGASRCAGGAVRCARRERRTRRPGAGLHLSERESLSTRAGRRAGGCSGSGARRGQMCRFLLPP